MTGSPFHAAGLQIEVWQGAGQLHAAKEALTTLAGAALEPNPFLCPWFLLPALEAFDDSEAVRVVVVRQPTTDGRPGAVVGLFPLVLRRGVQGLPVRCWALWQHDYNYLGVPLIHRDHGPACLDALFAWLRQATPRAGLLELPYLPIEGPFNRLLIDALQRWDRAAHVTEVFTRAFLQPNGRTGDAYLEAGLSSKHRRDLRRLEKNLADQGRLETRILRPDEDAEPWLEQFLLLEASGWKGKAGTAFASRLPHATFFRAMVRAAHAGGALRMLGLFLGERPLAMTCNLHSGPGGVAFKTAYDEQFQRYSPGLLLECQNLRRIATDPSCTWVDSCALPDHPMLNRLWLERRALHTLLIPTGRAPGELVLGLLPLLRWGKRLFKRRRDPLRTSQVPG